MKIYLLKNLYSQHIIYTQCNCMSQPNSIPELLTALLITTAVEFCVRLCDLNITSRCT